MSETTVAVVDSGGFVELAIALTECFDRVLYTGPLWQTSFPESKNMFVGQGVPGIERLDYLWDAVGKVDLWVFPDIYQSDIQKALIRQGELVWGSMSGDVLETNRCDMRRLQNELGLPTQKWREVKGVTALREYLAKHSDQFVKLDFYRGDMESFYAPNYAIAKPVIDDLENRVGPAAEVLTFCVESKIHAELEVGYDGYCVHGKLPKVALAGYEIKDEAYLGCAMPYEMLPNTVRMVNEALCPILGKHLYRNFFSTELLDEFLIDPCCRAGWPPLPIMVNMISNLGEIMLAGAQGELIEPDFQDEYCCQINLLSQFAKRHPLAVEFPAGMRRNLKFQNLCRVGDTYYILPIHEGAVIGAAVGTGATTAAAIKMAKEAAASLHAHEFEAKTLNLANALIEIAEAEKMGYPFGTKRLPKPEIVLEDKE